MATPSKENGRLPEERPMRRERVMGSRNSPGCSPLPLAAVDRNWMVCAQTTAQDSTHRRLDELQCPPVRQELP